VTVGTATSKL